MIYYLDKIITSHSETVIKAFGRLHATEHGEKIIFGAIIFGGLLGLMSMESFLLILKFIYEATTPVRSSKARRVAT